MTPPDKAHPRPIELLSPARDADTAIAAIDHGADAVYMGGPAFSARHAAGNTIEDIARAAHYAHRYRGRVYVTLNTILYDRELAEAENLIREVCAAGADALIVQDMAVLEMNLPPVELHASTQAHIDTPEKAEFLHRAGFSRIVVARELSAAQIEAIGQSTGAEIEAFVHGALCVSYSGQCYLSQAMASRSANRGRCAQVCRLPFEAFAPDGRPLTGAARHLLSLKDMNRSQDLERMIDAGVCSLKIEGRLKDTGYVKNITAYYRRCLDDILARRPDLTRSSDGTVRTGFLPDPYRSFNRGFTDYGLCGARSHDLSNPSTPKSLGQPAGKVVSADKHSLVTDSRLEFAAGDGFVVLHRDGSSEGFSINRAQGNRLFPERMPRLRTGDRLMRNSDTAFNRILGARSAERKVQVDFSLDIAPQGIRLLAKDESGFQAEVDLPTVAQPSRSPQTERLSQTLAKLGGTEFEAHTIDIRFPEEPLFIPLSHLADLRRKAIESLREARQQDLAACRRILPRCYPPLPEGLSTDYRLNVSNRLARRFYRKCGVESTAPAYELARVPDAQLALCLHCVKYSLGLCPRFSGAEAKDLPYLILRSPRLSLRAEFDCARCRMRLFELP